MYWVKTFFFLFIEFLLFLIFLFDRKLSEKLLSSAASANDVNEARCNPLVCEPTVDKFKILPQDYALVMMTNKVYEMYLKAGID